MNMKTMLCVATATLSSAVMASDTPEVSNVVMTQSEYTMENIRVVEVQ